MTTQTKVLIFIGLALVVVIGFSLTQGNAPEAATTGTNGTISEAEMNENSENMVDRVDGEMMNKVEAEGDMMKDDKMMDDATTAGVGGGAYLVYSPEAVANSNADNILLTFSANWCPSCRTLDKNINENFSSIPAGTEIYKVDYDTNVALRQKYGVTTQHTHVLVDNNGVLIKKWSGGNTLSELVANI